MLNLAPDVAADQEAADRFLDMAHAALSATGASPPAGFREAFAPVLAAVRADELERCIAALERVDRDGLEWVRGSLWESMWRRCTNELRARRRIDPQRDLPELHPVAYRYRYVYHEQGRVGPWKVRQAHIAPSPGSATMAGVDVQPLYTAPLRSPFADDVPTLDMRVGDVSGQLARYLDRRAADGKGPAGG